MLYKHWKKIALALTGFFWASCDDTVTTEAPMYGCPSEGCGQGPDDELSSSSLDHQVMPLYGVSEKVFISSSSAGESSSSFTEVAPAYGVPGGMGCYEDASSKESQGQITKTTYRCDDGVTCVEKDSITGYGGLPCSPMETEDGLVEICPDYGIVAITEKTYTCDDGNTYNYAEFISRYNKMDAPESTQGE